MYQLFFKRFLDIVLSLIALIILSPVFLALIVIGTIAMRGNPFFVQKRPGLIDSKTGKERIISLVKFRTMRHIQNENGDDLPDGERLTRYGRFLRVSSLDELPEIAMSLIGTMSLVGPRPQLVRDMTFMTSEQRRRHTVKPGITGLAQINGRNGITWEQKLAYDLEYIDNGITLWGDAKIFFKTFIKVASQEGVSAPDQDTAEDFGDYLLQSGLINQEEYERKQNEAKELLHQ